MASRIVSSQVKELTDLKDHEVEAIRKTNGNIKVMLLRLICRGAGRQEQSERELDWSRGKLAFSIASCIQKSCFFLRCAGSNARALSAASTNVACPKRF